jgi:hypothetical protein
VLDAVPAPPVPRVAPLAAVPPVADNKVPNDDVPELVPIVIVGKICPGITSTIPKAKPPPPPPAGASPLPPPPNTATPI